MILSQYENLAIQHDEALSFLRFQWRSSYSRSAIDYIHTMIRDRCVKRVVTDMRGLPGISIAEQAWLATSWFPRIIKENVECGALIMLDDNIYNQMVAESVIYLSHAFIRFDLQYFSDLPSALDWVTQSSAAVAALQQEWAAAYGAEK